MSDIIIEGGNIFRPDNEFHAGTITISDGIISPMTQRESMQGALCHAGIKYTGA